MSAILNTHVSLWDPSGSMVVLTPGDELPDWAEGRVGTHCFEAEASEPAAETGGDPGDAATATDEADAETEETFEAEASEPAAVDFTKPARRTATPKK